MSLLVGRNGINFPELILDILPCAVDILLVLCCICGICARVCDLLQLAIVLRGGRMEELPVASLVKGDVVQLNSGDRVPADLRIIKAKGCKVSQGYP